MWVWPNCPLEGPQAGPHCTKGPFPQATALPSPPTLPLPLPQPPGSFCNGPGEGSLGWRGEESQGAGGWRGRCLEAALVSRSTSEGARWGFYKSPMTSQNQIARHRIRSSQEQQSQFCQGLGSPLAGRKPEFLDFPPNR